MKTKILLLLTLLLFLISMACAGSTPASPTQSSGPDPDVQGTVDASIAATNTAAAAVQTTIDASVQATVQAQATPQPVDVSEMSEEEVVKEVEDAVNNAADASARTATTSTEATADGTVTTEEVETIYTDYEEAYAELLYAYELIDAYYDVYGELAEETLALLEDLEDDLDELYSSLDEISTVLMEIEVTLSAGVELAEETIAQLEAAAQAAQEKAAVAQTQAQTWVAEFQLKLEARATSVLEVLPDNIPADREAAIESLFVYLELVKGAIGDNKISSLELAEIAQARANSAAGIQAHGGPPLQNLVGQMDQLTVQLAKGQLPAARSGLGGFEASLPDRPVRP